MPITSPDPILRTMIGNDEAIVMAGVPATNMLLFHRIRFRVGDPVALMEWGASGERRKRTLILRDIEMDRARQHARADAIAALDAGARRGGLGPRVKAEPRDLNRRPLAGDELENFDAVVFDPPREGAAEQARSLALSSKVKRVVAVSCNPATFARDAALLIGGGYRLLSVTPVDQFLWSAHLELVGVFGR